MRLTINHLTTRSLLRSLDTLDFIHLEEKYRLKCTRVHFETLCEHDGVHLARGSFKVSIVHFEFVHIYGVHHTYELWAT